MSALTADAHAALITCDGVGKARKLELLGQLIADSEARATQELRQTIDDTRVRFESASRNMNEARRERDQLRAEVQQANSILMRCKDHDNAFEEKIAHLEREVERLTRALGNSFAEVEQKRNILAISIKSAGDQATRADCLQREVDRWVKWREEQPWLAEIHSYQQQVKSLFDEVARLKARLYTGCDDERDMAISEGPAHGVCGLAEELTKRAEHAEAAINREMDQRNEAVAERIAQQERAERAEAELDTIKRGHGELGRYEKLRLKNAALTAELAKERARLDKILVAVSAYRHAVTWDEQIPYLEHQGAECALDAAIQEGTK